jgi:hypothetical protein
MRQVPSTPAQDATTAHVANTIVSAVSTGLLWAFVVVVTMLLAQHLWTILSITPIPNLIVEAGRLMLILRDRLVDLIRKRSSNSISSVVVTFDSAPSMVYTTRFVFYKLCDILSDD